LRSPGIVARAQAAEAAASVQQYGKHIIE